MQLLVHGENHEDESGGKEGTDCVSLLAAENSVGHHPVPANSLSLLPDVVCEYLVK